MRKERDVVSVLGLVMPRIPVVVDVEALLRDDKPFRGTSYSIAKRMWRAYLYSMGKQIAHCWCKTKREAILARLEMERVHGKPGAMKNRDGDLMRPFPRTVIAPKAFVLDDALRVQMRQLAEVQSLCQVAITQGMRFRRGYSRSVRERLGNAVGGLMTVVDLLGMMGEVKAEHVEEGMLRMAAELGQSKKEG